MSEHFTAPLLPSHRTSGVALLFEPVRPLPHISPERLAADLQAEAYAAGFAAARQESEQRNAAMEAEWCLERARLAVAHTEVLAVRDAMHKATIAALDEALAEALAPLTHTVAQAMLGMEPAPALIQELAAQAIAAMREGQKGILRIAPGQPHPAVDGWVVQEDTSLPPGSICAEADCTRVTASLAGRLEQIMRELAA